MWKVLLILNGWTEAHCRPYVNCMFQCRWYEEHWKYEHFRKCQYFKVILISFIKFICCCFFPFTYLSRVLRSVFCRKKLEKLKTNQMECSHKLHLAGLENGERLEKFFEPFISTRTFEIYFRWQIQMKERICNSEMVRISFHWPWELIGWLFWGNRAT